jgi:DNA polymerase
LKTILLEKLNKDYQEQLNKSYGEVVKLVFGAGGENSKIVLVGEAPGKNEIIKGKPFVGQAGKNLDEFIEILEIERDSLYITNVVKMRPFRINPKTGRESNRPPSKEEIKTFTGFIEAELGIIKPKLVVSLGNVALRCLFGDDSVTIGNFHGSPVDVVFGGIQIRLFPLYHPASVIYRPELRKSYLQDLHKLKGYIKTML